MPTASTCPATTASGSESESGFKKEPNDGCNFTQVKNYLATLGKSITHEDVEEELVVVQDESMGIHNLVIDCEDPIVVLEQYILKLSTCSDAKMLGRLLQMNRTLVHGAFVLDEEGTGVLFRDTLQLRSLDLNELEASINALSMALAEHAGELLEFAARK